MKSLNDEAVSPVIGVILMVALTVILAAVIAAFVFGMVGSISSTKVIAAIISQTDANHIVVTYQGGKDAGMVKSIRWDVYPGGGAPITTTLTPDSGHSILEVGKGATISGSFLGKDHVVATALFSDGAEHVVLDAII